MRGVRSGATACMPLGGRRRALTQHRAWCPVKSALPVRSSPALSGAAAAAAAVSPPGTGGSVKECLDALQRASVDASSPLMRRPASTQTEPCRLRARAAAQEPPGLPREGKWRKGESLGGGAFGTVFVALNCETGELLAAKEIAVCGGAHKARDAVEHLESEVSVLSSLRHPNIVQYVGTQRQGDDAIYIFMEYVPVRACVRTCAHVQTRIPTRLCTRTGAPGRSYAQGLDTRTCARARADGQLSCTCVQLAPHSH